MLFCVVYRLWKKDFLVKFEFKIYQAMRLSIKTKKPEELLEKINTFLNGHIEWEALPMTEHNVKYTPNKKEYNHQAFVYFYIKELGTQKYIRAEFTDESTNVFLNDIILGGLISLLFHYFKDDIIRLSILKKKKSKH